MSLAPPQKKVEKIKEEGEKGYCISDKKEIIDIYDKF